MRIENYRMRRPRPSRGPYKDQASYEKARDEWFEEKRRLEAKFKADSIRAVGLEGHPKSEEAFAKAWEEGHSFGLNEVFSELQELADLMLEAA